MRSAEQGIKLIFSVALTFLVAGCSAFDHHAGCGFRPGARAAKLQLLHSEYQSAPRNRPRIELADFRFSDDRPVYVVRPSDESLRSIPVLLLHEMPGLSPDALELAQRIACNGYVVYVPLLFGKEDEDTESNWLFVRRSLSFLFNHKWSAIYRSDSHIPIIDDLTRLCVREILPRHPHQQLGVIGMCVSGSFPLALAAHVPQVNAPVVSQPATPPLPLTAHMRRSVSLSAQEMCIIRCRVHHGLQVLGFRFQNDAICPPERFSFLCSQLGEGFLDRTLRTHQYCLVDHLPNEAHAVLSCCYRQRTPGKAEPATHYAYRELITFLDCRLKRHVLYSDPPKGRDYRSVPGENIGGERKWRKSPKCETTP